MSSKDGVATSVCTGCGELFVCGASAGLARCWCMDRPVVALEPGADARCYCAHCLDQRISAQSSPPT